MSEPDTRRVVQLTPVWEAVVRDRRVPQHVHPTELLREIRLRVTRGDWPERQHALLVLADVLAVVTDEPPEAMALQSVLLTYLNTPAARNALQLLLHRMRQPEEALNHILKSSTSESSTLTLISALPEIISSQEKPQLLSRILEFLVERLKHPTFHEVIMKVLWDIRRKSSDTFDQALSYLPKHFYPDLTAIGFTPKYILTDSDTSSSGLEWSDTDSPKVVLEQDLQFSDDVVRMRITEGSASPPQTPGKERRVRFGGEAVKIRTPDSEREAPLKSRIPLPVASTKSKSVIDPDIASILEVSDWKLQAELINRLKTNLTTNGMKEKLILATTSNQGQTELRNIVKRLLQVTAPAAASALATLTVLPLNKLSLDVGDLVWSVVRYLGNSCDVATRIEAAQCFRHLLTVYSRNVVLQHVLGPRCLLSRTSRMRENALLAIILIVLAFPQINGQAFDEEKIIGMVCKSLKDPRRRVRLAALETLAVLAQISPRAFALVLQTSSEEGKGIDLLVEAVKTRLARRQLPSVSPEGLVLYSLQLNETGSDVNWILLGAGSSSTGSARSRGQLRAAQILPLTSPIAQEKNKWSASAERRQSTNYLNRQPLENEKLCLIDVSDVPKSPSIHTMKNATKIDSTSTNSTLAKLSTDSSLRSASVSPLPRKSFSANIENLTFPPIIKNHQPDSAKVVCASTPDLRDPTLPNIELRNSTSVDVLPDNKLENKTNKGEKVNEDNNKKAVKSKKERKGILVKGNDRVDKHANLYPESLRPFERPRDGMDMCIKQLASMQWEVTMQGLSSIVRLIRHHRDVLCSPQISSGNGLKPMTSWVARHVRSLRSQVARAAAQAARELLVRVDTRLIADAELDELCTSLFSRVPDTNRFLRADADRALDEMVDQVPLTRALQILLHKGATHQHALVRCATARLLLRLTEKHGVLRLFALPRDQRNALLKTGANFLTEGSLSTRSYAKSMFRSWSTHPDFSDAVVDAVSQSTMRAISKSLNAIKISGS